MNEIRPSPQGRDTRTFFNLGVYGTSQVVSALLALVQIGILARCLGRAGFGEFSFAFVVASLGGLLADFGLGPWLTRSVAQSPGAAGRLLKDVLRARFWLVLATWILVMGAISIYLVDPRRIAAVGLMLLYITGFGYVMMFESFLMGRQNVSAVASSVLGGKVLELCAVSVWALNGAPGQAAGAAGALAIASWVRAAGVGLVVRLALRRIPATAPIGPLTPPAGPLATARHAVPFAIGALVWTSYFKIDVLILERLVTREMLGLYTAAYRVLEALMLLPRSISGVSYPVVSAAWDGRALEKDILRTPGRALAAAGLAAAAGVWVVAPAAMRFLFGEAFVPGAAALRILAIALIPLFFNQFLVMILSATHRQSSWVTLTLVALGLNAAGNLLLIPTRGIEGAALVTLATEYFLLVTQGWLVWRQHRGLPSFSWLARAGLAAAAMGLIVHWIRGQLILQILCGIVIFGVLATLLGVITAEDRQRVRGLLRGWLPRTTEDSPPMPETAGPAPAPGDGECTGRLDRDPAGTARLSVVVLTHDSAGTLGRTLASLTFGDEILVVDSGSRDTTLDVARAAGARILARPLTGFADQRNAGLAAARGDWILFLDSDEVVDPVLAESIRGVTRRSSPPDGIAGYSLLMRNYFLNRPLLHGGLENDYHFRLVPRGRACWTGSVHEHLVAPGKVERLHGVVHHFTGLSLAGRFSKVDRYATARAADWRRSGRDTSPFRACTETLRFFFGRVVIRGGWRDGLHGILWWWLIATEILLAHFHLSVGQAEAPEDDPQEPMRPASAPSDGADGRPSPCPPPDVPVT